MIFKQGQPGGRYANTIGWTEPIKAKRIVSVAMPERTKFGSYTVTVYLKKKKGKGKLKERTYYFSGFTEYCAKNGQCHVFEYSKDPERKEEGIQLAFEEAVEFRKEIQELIDKTRRS